MYRFLVFGLLLVTAANGASIRTNEIIETPRIHSGEELIASIMSDCFVLDGMACAKVKVLTYLDTVLRLNSEEARSFSSDNIDKVIYERVLRIFNTNEIRVELPKAIFGDVTASYRADRGLRFKVSEKPEAARGLLKKKLLFPVLLLLKLKMKALMPILIAIIGLKAMKALILSKLAITIVLGFMIAQLVKKTGLGMPMAMMPMMPTEPSNAYGPPTTPATPDVSYGPAAWEQAPSSSNYAYRASAWEPSAASSSHNLAYSYYGNSPSSSASYSSSSSSGSSQVQSSSSSASSSATPQAY